MTDGPDSLKSALADRYTIEREIGSGGMAVVYLATDVKLGREVALKVLRPELAASLGTERFLREIEIAAKLNHPNILGLHDCGEADGQLYYTMPYVEGESLRDRLDREKQLPVEDALLIAQEVADALGHAHAMGLVHRDIKPENILLESGHAIVADFGIARAVTESGGVKLTETGIAIGTPAYMSPEQSAGNADVDARSDIYSLGCVLYEMLSGDTPYTASTPQAIIAKKLSEPTPRIGVVRETVQVGIEAALTKSLAKTPADRFVTAQQFADALARPSEGAFPVQRETGGDTERRGKRPLWHWMVGAGSLIVVAAVAVTLIENGVSGAEPADGEIGFDRFVVAPLENRTGDPAADAWAHTAAEAIIRDMDRASVVEVVPASTVRDMARDADRGARLPLEDIAQMTGARYAAAGSYSVSDERLRFDVELVDPASGELLRSLAPVDGPVDSLDLVMSLLAERVTAAMAAMLNPGIQAGWSSPPTLEAVTGLMATQDMYCRMRWDDVFEEAQSALEEAPDFPPLLYMVALSYAWSNRLLEADSVLSKLLSLREHMTSEEQRLAEWFHGNLHGDHDEATRAADQLFRINPGDYGWHAAVSAMITNDFDDALERLQAFDAESSCGRVFAPYWEELAKTYHMLGRYADELETSRRGLERDPGWRPLIYYEAIALAGLGRPDAVDSILDVIAQLPPEMVEWGYQYSPGMQTAYVALELRALGQRAAYQRVMDRALEWFDTQPSSELREWRAMALYYAERWSDADTLLSTLISEQPFNFDFRGHRGIVLANLGQREEAQEVDRWLEQLDLPFLVQARATRLRAAIAAALGDRTSAGLLLQTAYSEGMHLGYFHHRDPEWESLRDYRAYQELLTPEGM